MKSFQEYITEVLDKPMEFDPEQSDVHSYTLVPKNQSRRTPARDTHHYTTKLGDDEVRTVVTEYGKHHNDISFYVNGKMVHPFEKDKYLRRAKGIKRSSSPEQIKSSTRRGIQIYRTVMGHLQYHSVTNPRAVYSYSAPGVIKYVKDKETGKLKMIHDAETTRTGIYRKMVKKFAFPAEDESIYEGRKEIIVPAVSRVAEPLPHGFSIKGSPIGGGKKKPSVPVSKPVEKPLSFAERLRRAKERAAR